MKIKKTIGLLFSICISMLIVYQFSIFRTMHYSVEYGSRVRNQIEAITRFSEMQFKSADITNSDIQKFIDTVTEKYPSIAGVIFSENGNSILAAKKDSLFFKKEDFEKFSSMFISGALTQGKTATRTVSGKNYQYSIIKTGNYGILVIYSYRFSGILITRMIFEYIALFAVLAALFLTVFNWKSIFIRLRNSSLTQNTVKSVPVMKAGSNKSEISNGKIIDDQADINSISIHTKEISVKTLEAFIYEFFRKISINYTLSRIALCQYDQGSNSTFKTFETKGETFARFSRENTSAEIRALLSELKKGAVILRNKSRSLYYPLIGNGIFLGFVEMDRTSPMTGSENTRLPEDMKLLTEKLLKEVNKQ